MAIPQLQAKQAEKLLTAFCQRKVPSWLKDEMRLDFVIGEDLATLFQDRRSSQGSSEWFRFPMAQFRYIGELKQWSLHYYDTGERWQLYLNINPSLDLSKLIRVVDDDPMGFFWG